MSAFALYKITCAANGKVYIGYTSKTVEERFALHLQNARWKRKTALYDAMRCYGPEAFAVEEILRCADHAEACEHERRLIAELSSVLPNGYNMTLGGDGVPLTPEQREAANAKKRGRCSPKQLAANQRRKGTKASPETIAKLVASRKGKKHSDEHVRKRVEAFRRNRAAKLGVPYVEKPVQHRPRMDQTADSAAQRVGCLRPVMRRKRVWTEEARAAERERALKQWTPEAKQAAKERAARQWTPEARKMASDRIKARFASERKIA